jgi:chromate transporter
MSDSAVSPSEPQQAAVRPSLLALFNAFASASLSAFGGALPWVRRAIVEQRGWMTAEEFNEIFSLAQFLPGANALNVAVVLGARFRGSAGAAAAFCGLLGPPFAIVLVLAFLYGRYGDVATLNHVLAGISCSATGLIIAFVAKMIAPLFKRRDLGPAIAIIGFICVAIVQWPLPLVFIALAPISIAFAWFGRLR